MSEPDPVRVELRRRWAALLDRRMTLPVVVTWAQEQLSTESWTDEVTHQGLQLLNDQRNDDMSDAARQWSARTFERWIETVRQFEEDPISWNRQYAHRFLQDLPASMHERAAADFVRQGMLTDSEAAEFGLSN